MIRDKHPGSATLPAWLILFAEREWWEHEDFCRFTFMNRNMINCPDWYFLCRIIYTQGLEAKNNYIPSLIHQHVTSKGHKFLHFHKIFIKDFLLWWKTWFNKIKHKRLIDVYQFFHIFPMIIELFIIVLSFRSHICKQAVLISVYLIKLVIKVVLSRWITDWLTDLLTDY